MEYIKKWPTFGITDEIAAKLKKISRAQIDRYLKKDKTDLKLNREKSYQTHKIIKKPYPYPRAYSDYLCKSDTLTTPLILPDIEIYVK